MTRHPLDNIEVNYREDWPTQTMHVTFSLQAFGISVSTTAIVNLEVVCNPELFETVAQAARESLWTEYLKLQDRLGADFERNEAIRRRVIEEGRREAQYWKRVRAERNAPRFWKEEGF